MSRRDEVVESLDNAFSSLRRELSQALGPPAAAGNTRADRPSSSIRSALSHIVDLPPPNPPPAQGPHNGQDGRPLRAAGTPRDGQAPPTLASVPFGASAHQVFPIPETPPPGLAPPAHGDAADDGAPSTVEHLPSYSRRAPGAALRPAGLPPTRLHVHVSKSKKLEVQIKARGEDHVVLAQTEVDGDVWVEGKLTVNLPSAEPITHVRIRVKGVVRTMVMKVHGSGRHPVADEATLWEEGLDLWTPETFLPSNESTDGTKLQGTFSFPFKLRIPGTTIATSAQDGQRRLRSTPPSFVLSGNANDPSVSRGTEWGSVRYYVKVTLGRKGLLKVNERFIIPLVYVPRHAEPEMSAQRTVALAEGRPTPGPQEDPMGWNGQKMRHIVKRGMFSNKRAWYETMLLVPTPARFSRLSTIPFAIKITSSDPSTTTPIPPSSLNVYLIQRTHVQAQGLSHHHDMIVGQGVVEDDGPREGVELSREAGVVEGEGAVWERRCKGKVVLTKAVGSTFRAPNLAVSFLLAVYVSVPGPGNDSDVATPIEIVSSAPMVRSSRPLSIPSSASAGVEASAPAPAFSPPDEMGLPPSYFSVVEEEGRFGARTGKRI